MTAIYYYYSPRMLGLLVPILTFRAGRWCPSLTPHEKDP